MPVDIARRLKEDIKRFHYTHSIPSGKSHYFYFEKAIVVFSIPANKNISRFLGCDNTWELSRLYAPDGHEPNLLTRALSKTVRVFKTLEPSCTALISYADPNVGHMGYVYRAASWISLGQSEETRVYEKDGEIKPRRAFHSNNRSYTKAQLQAQGWVEKKVQGKYRFAKGLTRQARRAILIKQKAL